MDLTGLRALVRSLNFATFGVPATILPTVGPSVDTRIIWLDVSEQVPGGAELQRVERHRIAAIRNDEVPLVPRGTIIEIMPASGVPERWKVDGVERIEPDHARVFVVPE